MLLSSKYRRGRENAPCIRFRAGFRAFCSARVIRILESIRHRYARAAKAWMVAALLWVVAGATLSARADDATVTLNFVNADIDAVIKAVAEITGRNFVVDPRVKGTINIVSARPVPVSLVYPTLLSALRLQGFAAVESDGLVKIVPEADAKQHGGAVATGGAGAGGDRLVTQVITLKFESAQQLVNVLRPLITPNNTIVAYPTTNALIITDYAENLKRIDRIVATLDQPPAGEPAIVAVKYASALDLVGILNRVSGDSAGVAPSDSQQRVTLVADPRSNSIIVRSDNSGRVARVRQLIEQLDTPGRAGGNIFIIYLKNAEAARVAQTLRSLLSGGGDVVAQGAGSLAPAAGGGVAGAVANVMSGAAPLSGGGAGGGSVGFASGGVAIQADSANNALIIQAPEPVYNNLRAIIEKLDIRRAQVYVEALIVEVSADKAAQFGIQWQALTGVGKSGVQGIGGTNFGARGSGNNIIDTSAALASAGQGLNLGIINGTVTLPGLGQILNLAFLARALQTDANANILSTPAMLTLDNEEAKIVVGQNVPFITGQYAQTGTSSSVTPFQTIERKDVGLTLRVKPQITEGGSVRLVIYQEVSRVDSTSNPAGIITNKRSLESSVTIDDGQIVVLGGLIQDSFTDGTDKVPLAGDLPLVGALFRYDNRQRVKTNLMIFLKPTVVRGAHSADALTQDRYDYLLGEQQRMDPPPRLFWNDTTRPELQLPSSPSSAPLIPPMPKPAMIVPLPEPFVPPPETPPAKPPG
jgi:general secretion pathway protein D